MKPKTLIAIIAVSIISYVIYLYFFLPVPSFAPEIKILKRIEHNDVVLEWKKVIGILDQHFLDYITIQKLKQVDTICSSDNMADLKFENNKIIIGFYGSPKGYALKNISIPKSVLGYEIILDTTFISN